ncbi:UDP-N-acetylglucosamine transferase subunit [Fusarium piperis]|uniref:UDP-N-acetylglucosamine transferase subunit ALG14 n=1 Tax=Fusarium piperis TaxID=1435070 RepID=A0A9W8WAN1_9HYPO|nr:UDP-N-acetylglucosamine transferase subunit [Fusarium piperis]
MMSTESLKLLASIVAALLGVSIGLLVCFPAENVLFLLHLLFFVGLIVFLTARSVQITIHRRAAAGKQAGPGRRRDVDYHLFVLGSGGHTKEMLMMMDDGFCNFANFHRRYLITAGDLNSVYQVAEYETDLDFLCIREGKDVGTYDSELVARARRVHQSLWSTPFSALRSMLSIIPALLTPPKNDVGAKLRYPTCIFSNGPATGFFVGLVVYLLKVFYVVPVDSMKFVYVESWARISTLSLTGKLFYYTGIADVLVVQHAEVAAKYGIENAGEMVFNARRPDM